MNGLTSGSISLDLSGLTRSIVSALEPMLKTRDPLSHAEAVEALKVNMLGDGTSVGEEAEYLSQSLALAGYALVKVVGGPAPAGPPAQNLGGDTWFEPGRED